jgi:hypothetical protein
MAEDFSEYNDQQLSKLYTNSLQLYDDQLVILQTIMSNVAENRTYIESVEKEMLKRGFEIREGADE